MINDFKYIDLLDFKIKAGTVSSDKLCEIIVSNRYLGVMREEAIICMLELARRRIIGDDFAYEEKVDKLLASLPKFKLDLNKIFSAQKIVL